MAITRALLCTVLLSHASMAVANMEKHPDFESTVACMESPRKVGCTCAEVGLVDDSSGTSCAAGTSATFSACHNCCKSAATETCYGAYRKNSKMCGDRMELDVTKLKSVAGVKADEQKTNCCKAMVKKTCAQITCTNRRRRAADSLKAKAGVETTECTESSDCDSKCCQENDNTCAGNSLSSNSSKQVCGAGDHADYVGKALTTKDTTTCDDRLSAAGAATFTDSASFQSACCDAKADYSTCSSFSCPTGHQKKATMPTGKCSGTACTSSECCEKMATTTLCMMSCDSLTSGAVKTVYNTANAVCGNPGPHILAYCASAKCDAATQVLDIEKLVLDKASPTDADIKSACCVHKPADSITTSNKPADSTTSSPAKCSAFFSAAAADEAKNKGHAAAANAQKASMPIAAATNAQKASVPILAAAVLLSAKLFF